MSSTKPVFSLPVSDDRKATKIGLDAEVNRVVSMIWSAFLVGSLPAEEAAQMLIELAAAVDATAANREQTGLDRAAAESAAATAAADASAQIAPAVAAASGFATAASSEADRAEAARDAAIAAGSWTYRVDTEADLAGLSPSLEETALVLDTMHVWRWDGSDWIDTGESPLASKADRTEVAQVNEDIRGRLLSATALPALSEAGVALVLMDRDTGQVAGWIDRAGVLHAEVAGSPRRMPAPALDYVPLWGAQRDGEFLGFAVDGEVIGRIDRALTRAGIAPDPQGYGLDWGLMVRGAGGEPVLATRPQGGLVDFGRARAPVVATEWLTPAGVRVAPLTAGAVECVVAYFRTGERRVLTPPTEGLHYRAPELAWGGVSVRCWRWDGAGPGELVAVSIQRPGFVVDDDPDVAWMIIGDGQSLAQGSHGAPTPWPYTSVQWPDHLLTVDNTVLPGDIRTGRNAGDYLFRLDPATLIGLTPIRPQTGVLSGHGLTPVEALACQLQDDIVTYIGRPQRIVAWTGGVGGASITQLTTGTANDLNQRDVAAAAVRFARERGWQPVLAAVQWTHGETDAPMQSADYAAAVDAYRDDLDAYVMGLTGQSRSPLWLLAQPSSFAESIDNETTSTSVIGMMELMAARPEDTIVTGPGYADQAGYAADCMHMTNAGYLAQGEANAGILRAALWGGAEDRPLYALSAEISGAVITVQWSEPVEVADDMPARPNLGVEVSNGSGSFLEIVSHTLAGSASTITLSAPVDPGDVAALRVQIGMTGQSYPERLPENVPTTNIRTVRTAYRAYATGVLRHRHALHQRLPVTSA